MVKEQGLPYLVKQLLASGVRLNGKLQLCIHGGHTHTDLGWDERKQISPLALNVSVQLWRKKIQMPRSWVNKKMVWRKVKYWHKSYPNHILNHITEDKKHSTASPRGKHECKSVCYKEEENIVYISFRKCSLPTPANSRSPHSLPYLWSTAWLVYGTRR